MRSTRAWLAVSPLVAGGVLGAHALAYRLTSTPAGPAHQYLEHLPQLVVVLALLGFASAGLATRLRLPPAWAFPAAALAAFAVQEHAERLTHTGDVPWLLTTPAFVVGVLLQLPVAIVVWLLARTLLEALAAPQPRRPPLPRFLLTLPAPAAVRRLKPPAGPPLPARGPPLLHRP